MASGLNSLQELVAMPLLPPGHSCPCPPRVFSWHTDRLAPLEKLHTLSRAVGPVKYFPWSSILPTPTGSPSPLPSLDSHLSFSGSPTHPLLKVRQCSTPSYPPQLPQSSLLIYAIYGFLFSILEYVLLKGRGFYLLGSLMYPKFLE